MMESRERMKVDVSPIKLRIESEPYVIFLGRAFVAVIDVYDIKNKREFYLPINAQSISIPLHSWYQAEGKLSDIEFWINKESELKTSKYEIELA
jgi:hypothetical protein